MPLCVRGEALTLADLTRWPGPIAPLAGALCVAVAVAEWASEGAAVLVGECWECLLGVPREQRAWTLYGWRW